VTVNKSHHKARALTYLQEQTHPQSEDWHIYLDEESKIDEVFIAGIYRFIVHSEQKMRQPKHRYRGYIGQGTIIYQGGHWFFRGADAIRTADDLGRFHFQYRLGMPIFGMHGSFIVVRGIDEASLTFDVGPRNSIAEDTAWALRAWMKGFRFAWIDGFLYEQPPQTVKDFIKQRCRWLIGIRLVLGDKTLPLRYKWCLGIFTYSWHLSLIPTLVAIMALFTHTNAFLWVQIPANFVWTVFFLSYLQGTHAQTRRSAQFFFRRQSSYFQRVKMQIFSSPLALGIFWYTLLESVSILYSCIRPRQGFFVIRKPVLFQRQQEDTP
jgi:beta-1,4-mannosyltransferase